MFLTIVARSILQRELTCLINAVVSTAFTRRDNVELKVQSAYWLTGDAGTGWYAGLMKKEKRFAVIQVPNLNWPILLQIPSGRFRLFVAADVADLPILNPIVPLLCEITADSSQGPD